MSSTAAIAVRAANPQKKIKIQIHDEQALASVCHSYYERKTQYNKIVNEIKPMRVEIKAFEDAILEYMKQHNHDHVQITIDKTIYLREVEKEPPKNLETCKGVLRGLVDEAIVQEFEKRLSMYCLTKATKEYKIDPQMIVQEFKSI